MQGWLTWGRLETHRKGLDIVAQLGNDSHSLLPSLALSQSTLMPQEA